MSKQNTLNFSKEYILKYKPNLSDMHITNETISYLWYTGIKTEYVNYPIPNYKEK